MRGEISSARNLWHSRSRGLPLPGLPPALSEDRESGAQNPFARRHSARGAAECRHQSMPPREETRSDRGPHAPGTVHPKLALDRKSTRLNSSHGYISYAVFCLKKKTANPSSPAPAKSTPVHPYKLPSVSRPLSHTCRRNALQAPLGSARWRRRATVRRQTINIG